VVISSVAENDKMKGFIFEDLAFLKEVKINALEELNFLNTLYFKDLGECVSGKRVFGREEIGKLVKLRVADDARINFPVDFVFRFKRSYSISEDGEVEVL